MDQWFIAVLGVTGAFLSQCRRARLVRYACLFGLASQPFWLYATFNAGQWGMFILSVLYTVAWCYGVWVHWLSKNG